MKKYCHVQGGACEYSLSAIVSHVGGLESGHYKAFVKFCSVENRWFVANDQKRCINLLTRFRVVDNSELGKLGPRDRPPYLISRHKKRRYQLGDIVTVAIKGKTSKAMIVGLKKKSGLFIPSTSTNNIILLDENKNPLGTRATVPIPMIIGTLRKDCPKILSMVSKFI
ncbi:hypothetical protein MXB_5445 [Myxobolus squamalis]|nr:hypothetical protein MXB_5445 [Myxobolus squamalis]